MSTGRASRLEATDRVAQVPALPGSFQHAALAAYFGQRSMAAWTDGQDLAAPGGGLAGIAVLDGKCEGWGGGAITKCAPTHGQSLDA